MVLSGFVACFLKKCTKISKIMGFMWVFACFGGHFFCHFLEKKKSSRDPGGSPKTQKKKKNTKNGCKWT
jgi:hypothetical protein